MTVTPPRTEGLTPPDTAETLETATQEIVIWLRHAQERLSAELDGKFEALGVRLEAATHVDEVTKGRILKRGLAGIEAIVQDN